MTIKIYRMKKYNLKEINSIDVSSLGMTSSTSMVISHYADNLKSTEATIPFTIEGSNKHVPQIGDVEYYLASRKEVDLTAIGVNSNIIGNSNKDIGKCEYKDSLPKEMLDLPPGFQELYKG